MKNGKTVDENLLALILKLVKKLQLEDQEVLTAKSLKFLNIITQ